jgi:hypothetical protein
MIYLFLANGFEEKLSEIKNAADNGEDRAEQITTAN